MEIIKLPPRLKKFAGTFELTLLKFLRFKKKEKYEKIFVIN